MSLIKINSTSWATGLVSSSNWWKSENYAVSIILLENWMHYITWAWFHQSQYISYKRVFNKMVHNILLFWILIWVFQIWQINMTNQYHSPLLVFLWVALCIQPSHDLITCKVFSVNTAQSDKILCLLTYLATQFTWSFLSRFEFFSEYCEVSLMSS